MPLMTRHGGKQQQNILISSALLSAGWPARVTQDSV